MLSGCLLQSCASEGRYSKQKSPKQQLLILSPYSSIPVVLLWIILCVLLYYLLINRIIEWFMLEGHLVL